jgi:hypothetical protein
VSEEDRPRQPTAAVQLLDRYPGVRALLLVLPALVGSLASYAGASSKAETQAGEAARVSARRSDVVKDKAEAGYQVSREALGDLQEEIRQLKAEVAALKRAVRAGAKTVPRAVPAAAPAP